MAPCWQMWLPHINFLISVVGDTKLIPYDASEKVQKPINIVLTEFHILVLYPDRLKAYCRLNEELAYDDPYAGTKNYSAFECLLTVSALRKSLSFLWILVLREFGKTFGHVARSDEGSYLVFYQ